jgi:hypothetical protein
VTKTRIKNFLKFVTKKIFLEQGADFYFFLGKGKKFFISRPTLDRNITAVPDKWHRVSDEKLH